MVSDPGSRKASLQYQLTGSRDWRQRLWVRILDLLRTVAVVLGLGLAAACQSAPLPYVDRHDFQFQEYGSQPSRPIAGITFDADGNRYGTTSLGGTFQNETELIGVVWEIAASGAFKVLHNFGGTVTNADGTSGPDGLSPESPVLVDSAGDLFGTAAGGGPNGGPTGSGLGMIWEITAAGDYKDLHDFGGTVTNADGSSGPDGTNPIGALYRDATGDLFGVAVGGGADDSGILWELSTAGVYKDLHDFGGTVTNASGSSGPDGIVPENGLTADSAGDLFGTAVAGGPFMNQNKSNDGGVLWEFTAGGTYRDLHDFGGTVTNSNGSSGPDGEQPGCLVFDPSGNLYGNAAIGGMYAGAGIIWEISSTGVYRDNVHDFGGTTTNGGEITNANGTLGPDGYDPSGPLAVDGNGDLFGTTNFGGPNLVTNANVAGMAWEISSSGQYSDLHDFGGTIYNSSGASGPDGDTPVGVTLGPGGKLFGVCSGINGGDPGIVWEMGQEQVVGLSIAPSAIGGLGTAVGTVVIAGPAPAGGWLVNLNAGASGYLNLPSSVTVAEGSTSATFTISGTAPRGSTIDMGIFARDAHARFESILTIQGDEVNGLSFSPSTIGGGGSTTATVTLASAAPAGGWVVNLRAGASGYLSLPGSITVPAGATSATFTITGVDQRTGTLTIGIVASDAIANVESLLTVQGDSLTSITLSPSTVGWSGTSTGTVTLTSAAPPGGWVVNLKAGASGYLSMPSSVSVPAGATSATFSVTGASQRTESVTIGVIANDVGNQVEADLTLTGDSLTGVSVNPTSVPPGGGSTGTVTLSGPAPVGGWVVKLWAGAPTDVQVPATVTVPAGATSATFSITTPISAHPSAYGVFANDGTAQFETLLTIT